MATENPSPPEGFDSVEPSGNEDVPTVDLEPGDVLCGTVSEIEEGEGDYGPWCRTKIVDDDRGLVRYYAEDRAKVACASEKVTEGEHVWIGKAEVEQQFEDDEGENRTYFPVRCAVDGGGD
jgi:hypothetical protein